MEGKKETMISAAQTPATILGAVAPALPVIGPFLGAFANIFKEIFDLTEKADHNKKVCRRLTERIRVANKSLEEKRLYENVKALELYEAAIKQARDFIKDISKTSSFMKLLLSRDIEWQFNRITSELDGAILQLGLDQIVRTRHDIDDDSKLLRSEIKSNHAAIEQVMNRLWEQGMDIGKKVEVLGLKIDAIHGAVATRIKCEHIIDPDEEVVRGNGKVKKKLFISQEVAQRETDFDSLSTNLTTIEKEVAILTELKDCQHIIRFYGTMKKSGKLYIISEWAEMGDLYTYLRENKNLSWPFKIRIASEIASGLIFCHTFGILHHDIRSHNILLTQTLQAKLSKFHLSRREADSTCKVHDIIDRYRWLAPEKLASANGDRYVEYTKQCDIYSFAIVLWELASQELPFSEIAEANPLIEAISSGIRPPSIPGTPTAYEKVMTQAWNNLAIKRPTASQMLKEFNKLIKSNEFHSNSQEISSSRATGSISISRSASMSSSPPTSNTASSDQNNLNSSNNGSSSNNTGSCSGQSTNEPESDSGQAHIDPINNRTQRDSGVPAAKKLHNQKKYSQAWPIFKEYADRGDAIAEFYVGYYLISGDRSVQKDAKQAIEYFRRSAEKGIPDAQFRYGVALLTGEGVGKTPENDQIAVENLIKAANSGNPNAMFNYGDLLINGAHGIQQDLEKGTEWMRSAHKKGHPHAYKKLADRLKYLNKEIPQDIQEEIRKNSSV